MAKAEKRLALVASAIALTLAAFVFVARPAGVGRTYLLRDIVGQFHPWRAYARAQMASGVIPLWNPYNQGGNPFAANPQTQVFYPPSLVFLCGPFGLTLTLYLAAHALLAGAGMYVLLRRLGCGHCASLVGAVAYGYNGWAMTRLEFVPVFASAAWAPWALVALERCIHRPRVRNAILAGLVLTLQTLAGSPNNLFICGLCYGCFLVVTLIWLARRSLRQAAQACACLAAVGMFAGAVSCVQVAPLAEFSGLSLRAEGVRFDYVARRSLFASHLRTLVQPFAYGRPGYASYRAPGLHEFWCGSYYVGLLPLALAAAGVALALWGCARSRRLRSMEPSHARLGHEFPRGAWVFALVAMCALGVALALGKHSVVFRACYAHIPLFDRFRWPCKFIFMAVLGLTALAGLGADEVLRRVAGRPGWQRAFGLAAVAFVAADLWWSGSGLNPTVASEFYDARPHIAPPAGAPRVLCSRDSRFLNNYLYGCTRESAFAWARQMLLAYANLVEGVDAAHADDPLRLRRGAQLLELAETDRVPAQARARLLHMLGVAEVREAHDVSPECLDLVDTPPAHVVRKPLTDPFPRAWFVPTALVFPSVELGRLAARGFDPRAMVIIAGPQNKTVKLAGTGSVRLRSRSAHRVEAALAVRGRGWMVLSDAACPGWAAYVDGRKRAIAAANFALRAVAVSEEDREAEFVYAPRSFKWGAGVSLAALAAVFAIAAAAVGRPRTGV